MLQALQALDVWLITSFCFNFMNLIEFCIVTALLRNPTKSTPRRKGAGKERDSRSFESKLVKRRSRENLAYSLDRWSKVLLPVLYCFFLLAFFVHFLPYEKLPEEEGKKNVALQEIGMIF